MKKTTCLLFLCLCAVSQVAFAQNAKIDSLLKVLKTAKEDTNKVNTLDMLSGNLYLTGKYEQAIEYCNQAILLAQKIHFKSGIGSAYNLLGNICKRQGNYYEALKHYQSSLIIANELNDKKGISAAYNNMGTIKKRMGNYPEALKFYFLSLKIDEELGDKNGVGISHENIGLIYIKQSNYKEGLEYLQSSLNIKKELNDKHGMAFSYNNIGLLYSRLNNYSEALNHHFKALEIREEIKDQYGISSSFNNIGSVYSKQKNYVEALKYQYAALKIQEEIGDKLGTSGSFFNIGQLLLFQKKYIDARSYFLKGQNLSISIGDKDNIKHSYELLSGLDSAEGNYKQALENYKLYTLYNDSLLNEDNNKQIAEMKTIYETEKKDAEITLLNKDKEIKEKEITKQKLVRNGFVGGFGLTLLLAASIFFSLQQNKKKNKIITAQKVEVEEKNKKITDSIEYALRIQTAILPPDKLVKEYLKNSFVLYLPKDIVAGDFYWMETMEVKGGEGRRTSGNPSSLATRPSSLVLFAACDCTGHGVPGAMVSVMCHNALNRAVREYNLTEPAKILDKVVDLVEDNFTKSDEEIQDGMDASLCAYYPEQKKLQWAGANNPLWIVRNNEIIEYKPDKQPIGKYDYRKPYTNHEIELREGDTFYIFSDGYHDQFGDDGEKKLTKKGLRKILLGIQDKPMNEQRAELLRLHNRWKGEVEQIDDICVIGVRV